MRNIIKMPSTHPYMDVTHYTIHEGEAIFFYYAHEPQEEGEDKKLVGWLARVGDQEYGDFVTVENFSEATLKDTRDILFDQAVSTITELKKS